MFVITAPQDMPVVLDLLSLGEVVRNRSEVDLGDSPVGLELAFGVVVSHAASSV